MDNLTTQILRAMAWQRAKGELMSMLESYINDKDKFDILTDTIEDFINDVEQNGKHD